MDAKQLDDTYLNEIYQFVLQAASKWFNFGLSLGVDIHQLEDIESCCHDNQTSLRKMLTHWLRTSPSRTWTDIYTALRSETVQRKDIAKRIKQKVKWRYNL